MNNVIYGDLFIMGNSFVNMVVFIFVGKFIKKTVGLLRYGIVSLMISIAYFMAVYNGLIFSGIVSQLLIVLAVFLLYRPKNIWETLIFYLIVGIFSFVSVTAINIFRYYTGIEWAKVLIPLGLITANTVIKFTADNIHKTKNYYDVEISNNNKTVILRGFLDTGHNLVEPISKKPVIIAEYQNIKPLLPPNLCYIFENESTTNIYRVLEAAEGQDFTEKIKFIPFSSIGNERGILIGFEMKKAVINNKTINNPIIGIYKPILSKSGLYNALLSPRHIGGSLH